MNFRLEVPPEIVFGAGEAAPSLKKVARWGGPALLVTGSRPERADWARNGLAALGVGTVVRSVSGEPRVQDLLEAVDLARSSGARCVLGIGGGSALDLAKAVAALAPHRTDPMEHLEVVGRGQPIPGPGLPCAAYPTTAGTGAEATRNAVLSTGAVKVSLRGPELLPRLAVVDPELCLGLGPETTAWCALDALTQLVESMVSREANPATEALCREGIPRVVASLPRVLQVPDDIEARSDLSLAALFSGIALANSRLGAVHGLAGPLGGRVPAPHGAVCARLLPLVWDANVEALREVDGRRFLSRFREVARILSGSSEATLEDGSRVLHGLSELAGAPGLSRWGLSESDIPRVGEDGLRASSMKGNPVDLGRERLEGVLRRAL